MLETQFLRLLEPFLWLWEPAFLLQVFGYAVIGAPALLFVALGISSLLDRPLSERATGVLVQMATLTGFLATLGVLTLMLLEGTRQVPLNLGAEMARVWGHDLSHWVEIPNYQFTIKFEFDRLSVPLVILSFVLCGTIGAFANRYMHRERGFNRFFVLFALFLLGMVVTSLAGTIETLFAGWEMVGLSSAFLVGFFQDRPAPVQNGLRVWSVYRISDAALLMAAVALHHVTKVHGEFDKLLGDNANWPELSPGGIAAITEQQALVIGILLIIAAAGKSALVPFSGWLPRAMEGPTPSSAVFYGALSVHLGAYLLLRISPLFVFCPPLRYIVIGLGLVTVVFASFAGRVQTDIKCALSFASLTQVGIIVIEVGLAGFWPFFDYVALVHLLGHACFRTLQFLRAPTILYDFYVLENAIGGHLPRLRFGVWDWLIPPGRRLWFYRLALERGYLDALLADYIVTPFLGLFRWFDAAKRGLTSLVSGQSPEMPEHTDPLASPMDDLR